MNIGMMWFDNSKSPLSTKIEGAISYYEKKYGQKPNLAKVNPSTKIDGDCNGIIEIQTTKIVFPNYIWLGIKE